MNNAMGTDQFSTRFAIQLQGFVMFGAARECLLWGDQSNQVPLYIINARNIVGFKLLPLFVQIGTLLTDELGALSAKAGGFTSRLDTFLAGRFLRFLNFLEFFLDVEQMMDIEGSLEATHPSGGVGGWAGDTWGNRAGLVDCGQLYPRDNIDSRRGNKRAVEGWCRAPDNLGTTADPPL